MNKYKFLSKEEMSQVTGGNAPGNAVIGGLGGLKAGIKFCKVAHPILKGVCVAGFTASVAYLAYKAN
ncbi:Blp family class II bacteriocin [Streptococcus didelphis]|uniref:Blp family class II bacteriocin n=1 Tax=Streptococcus didelphis TaxID=102886 RepID=A0ABY9LI38_9STRE|nr:Blp family class II bacteriocin [Streptococcus didelphis]WMB28488.1 Blp family class II bacteriocin [Streptococcus didelphis]WMB29164.1 Blp family class II bacteriocin [Streptococcus didelphis]